MANEEEEFNAFCAALVEVFANLESGQAYLVIDRVSTDATLRLARDLSEEDPRFHVVWLPENKSVVDAYIGGFAFAYKAAHSFIIEMDAGMSHNPATIPVFLEHLHEGAECVFGSRFIKGGSMGDSPMKRVFLSRFGSILANVLLGTTQKDMTSGFQGFQRDVVGKIIDYPLKSTGHFYQTELRYLLRKRRYTEVPIHYKCPSPRVSGTSVKNAYQTLWYYFKLRVKRDEPFI